MKGAAWRVGLFTLAGLGVLALAVVLVGGHWFVARESALMRFSTSVYGLQVGAPVVFRGVRIGLVKTVQLASAGPATVAVPVTAEFVWPAPWPLSSVASAARSYQGAG